MNMQTFPFTIFKPEVVIGLQGFDKFNSNIQKAIELIYIKNVIFIPITTEIIRRRSLRTKQREHAKKVPGILSENFFTKLKTIPALVVFTFDISQSNIKENATTTDEKEVYESYCQTVSIIKEKYPDPSFTMIAIVITLNNIVYSDTISSLMRSNGFQGMIEKKNITFVEKDEIANVELLKGKLSKIEFAKYTTDYYKVKKNYYEGKKKSGLPKECIAKLAIKIGSTSLYGEIDKTNVDSYKEAYVMINDINHGNQIFSSGDKRVTYIEKRNIEDWLLINIVYHQNLEEEPKKNLVTYHLRKFDYETYLGPRNDSDTEVDLQLYAMSCYWKMCMYDFFDSTLEDSANDNYKQIQLIHFIMRLITLLKEKKDILIKNPVDLSSVAKEKSNYLEKISSYFYMDDNTTKCTPEINLKIFYKNFIGTSSLTPLQLTVYLKKKINKFFFLKPKWGRCQLNLRMLLLSNDLLENYEKEEQYLLLIQNELVMSSTSVYLNFIQKFNDLLFKQKPLNANQITINLLKITEVRELTTEENDLMQKMLAYLIENKQTFIYQIKSSNHFIKAEHSFSNYHPSICDLITMTLLVTINIDELIQFNIKTCLLQFNQINRTKKIIFEAGKYPLLSKNNPFQINNDLFIQPSDSNLNLTMIQLETVNGLIFLVTLNQDIHKCLRQITEAGLKNQLEVILPLNYIVGINEYHYYSFDIQKRNQKIKLDEIEATFAFIQTMKIPINEFIWHAQNKENSKTNDKLHVKYKDPINESRIGYLLKILSISYDEPFIIEFEIKIKISHIDLPKDHFLYEDKGIMQIEVKDPFEFHSNIQCHSYQQKGIEIIYPTETEIETEIIAKNSLHDKLIISDFVMTPLNSFVKVSSLIRPYLNKRRPLYPSSEVMIPARLNAASGADEIANAEISWYTKELYDYDPTLINSTNFYFPIISIQPLPIKISSKYNQSKELFTIHLSNKSEEPLSICITYQQQTNNEILFIGKTKEKTIIMPKIDQEITINLIFLYEHHDGSINFPITKVDVLEPLLMSKASHVKELYSIYYKHEK